MMKAFELDLERTSSSQLINLGLSVASDFPQVFIFFAGIYVMG